MGSAVSVVRGRRSSGKKEDDKPSEPSKEDNKPSEPSKEDTLRDKRDSRELNHAYASTIRFLSKVPLFKRLPVDQHPRVAAACTPAQFETGDVVIKPGDPDLGFFVIRSGKASAALVAGGAASEEVALEANDYFGEDEAAWREATVTAQAHLSAVKIARDKFRELGLGEKLQFPNRAASIRGQERTAAKQPPSEKSPEERELIAGALRGNANLTTMVTLDDARIEQIIEVAWKEEVPSATEVIREGDPVADRFYVVQGGSFEVSGAQSTGEEGSAAAKALLGTVGAGGSFGELALLYLVDRSATVSAAEDSVVWVVDSLDFKRILMRPSEQKLDQYVAILGRLPLLDRLWAAERRAVAEAVVEMHFAKGEVVLQQGEAGSTFYILYSGSVSLVKDGVQVAELSASEPGQTAQYFGEDTMLTGEPRAATACVLSDTAKCLGLDRQSFDRFLRPLADVMRASSAGGEPGRRKILRRDLQKIGLLGCGGFGLVTLWEHKLTHETFALKALNKGYIVKTGMQECVYNEKNIQMMTNSPFIIRLYETYNGPQTLYMLMEPALGGELYATYNKKSFHGNESYARFFVAGVALAFEHMHERWILYRDLKPENVLLDSRGYVKLTDMALAKLVVGKTYTTCGTPDYFAPELISSSGHSLPADWWTLGILTFELMAGHPPFEDAYPMQVYAKVMKGIGKVTFPPKCKGALEDFIKALLKEQPDERLPVRAGGSDNLKRHKWYAGFNWEALADLTMDPPYKPLVASNTDLSNFYADAKDSPKELEYRDNGMGWDRDWATF